MALLLLWSSFLLGGAVAALNRMALSAGMGRTWQTVWLGVQARLLARVNRERFVAGK